MDPGATTLDSVSPSESNRWILRYAATAPPGGVVADRGVVDPAVRGGLEHPRDQGYPRAAGGTGQPRAERAVQRLRHGLQIRAEPGLGRLREHGQGGAVPCGVPEGPADPGEVHRRIRADGQLAERDPHGRSVNHRDVTQQGRLARTRRRRTCDLMTVWTDHC